MGLLSQVTIARLRGEHQKALTLSNEALSASAMSGYPFMRFAAMGALCGSNIDISPARIADTEPHEETLSGADTPMGRIVAAFIFADLAECGLRLGNLEMAHAVAERGLTIPRATYVSDAATTINGAGARSVGARRC